MELKLRTIEGGLPPGVKDEYYGERYSGPVLIVHKDGTIGHVVVRWCHQTAGWVDANLRWGPDSYDYDYVGLAIAGWLPIPDKYPLPKKEDPSLTALADRARQVLVDKGLRRAQATKELTYAEKVKAWRDEIFAHLEEKVSQAASKGKSEVDVANLAEVCYEDEADCAIITDEVHAVMKELKELGFEARYVSTGVGHGVHLHRLVVRW